MELSLLLKTSLVLLSAPPPGQAFFPRSPPCTHISPRLLPCPSGELRKPSARTAAGVQGRKAVFCPSTTLLFHKHTHGCRLYGQDASAPAGKLPAACSSWWEWPPGEGGAGGAVGLFSMWWQWGHVCCVVLGGHPTLSGSDLWGLLSWTLQGCKSHRGATGCPSAITWI